MLQDVRDIDSKDLKWKDDKKLSRIINMLYKLNQM